ncbi:MAG: MFS transporter [Cytophagales bacterium]|nr:MFS transporter [Bernardetiaceae bacterium]MDW8209496.1 MFS transporter [Cytophagales bacterium]
MSQSINRSRLFVASCLALITTAMAFAIRAGIMNDLTETLGLSDTEKGWINQMAFLGFPVATIIGGALYNSLGPKKLGYIAFVGHLLGITFTLLSNSFWPLFLSTFLIGFANGMVEAAFNPLVASMYDENKTTMLNRFHVWFPGGIVIGSLIAFALSQVNASWQVKISTMYIPTIIYGFLFFGQRFPEHSGTISMSNAENLRTIFTSPLFWFMMVCMTMTATTELGTQQWVERILGQAGAAPMLVLALVTGLMAVGRYFAGPIVHQLNITGVLLGSAIISAISIYLMSSATGFMVYVYAVLFAVGVCYFWPNMISFVAEYMPKTGALGMSLMGGAGMFGASIFQPLIGYWLDTHRNKALVQGLSKEAAELLAGQATLAKIALIPTILIFAFGFLLFLMRNRQPVRAHT